MVHRSQGHPSKDKRRTGREWGAGVSVGRGTVTLEIPTSMAPGFEYKSEP